ncbi:MAG: hypothetical protein JWL70_285 [Acidimicrobiia bacterium]|nr:hypothetical protein [Acidimicrobiia bacterium]
MTTSGSAADRMVGFLALAALAVVVAVVVAKRADGDLWWPMALGSGLIAVICVAAAVFERRGRRSA